MKERPILFSAPMVRAILAGTKTQTRRVVKPQPEWDETFNGGWVIETKKARTALASFNCGAYPETCPYGQPGDRLWVRERGWIAHSGQAFIPYVRNEEILPPKSPDGTPYKPCPSIHMPRWASRILLEVVSVRVERLQDITRGDAMDEGCPFPNMADGPDPTQWYADLWQQINGPGSWSANPWVWVVEFRRIEA